MFIDGYTKEIKIVNKFNVRTSYFKPKIENLFLRHVKKHSFIFCNIKRKFVHFKPIINFTNSSFNISFMSSCVFSVVYRVVSSAKIMNLNTALEWIMSFIYDK